MKYLPTIASILLGLLFLMASITFLFSLAPMPPTEPGSAAAHFSEAFIPTGYMTFVKVCELVGATLLLIPRTRNFGLLILCPIIVNIIANSIFVTKDWNGPGGIILLFLAFAPLYLLWVSRKAFAGLLIGGCCCTKK